MLRINILIIEYSTVSIGFWYASVLNQLRTLVILIAYIRKYAAYLQLWTTVSIGFSVRVSSKFIAYFASYTQIRCLSKTLYEVTVTG